MIITSLFTLMCVLMVRLYPEFSSTKTPGIFACRKRRPSTTVKYYHCQSLTNILVVRPTVRKSVYSGKSSCRVGPSPESYTCLFTNFCTWKSYRLDGLAFKVADNEKNLFTGKAQKWTTFLLSTDFSKFPTSPEIGFIFFLIKLILTPISTRFIDRCYFLNILISNENYSFFNIHTEITI